MAAEASGPDRGDAAADSASVSGAARRIAWYGVAVFLSSACVLVLEIVAGRLLAPYIGVSIYTWTSIIGVILAGLSLGNWIGGLWADAGGDETAAGQALAASGVASLAVLWLLLVVAARVQGTEISLLGASFIYVSSLFFLPAMLLGIVTPLLTTLALRRSPRTGRVVGFMHAMAALGSIAGTFVTGYWLVQAFGTRSVIAAVATLQLLLAVPFLLRRRLALGLWAALALVSAALASAFDALRSPCTAESRYYCIRVVDEAEAGVRSLVLDHMVHSTNVRADPGLLVVPYVHAMDELARTWFGPDRMRSLTVFFAGGGAYTHPRALRSRLPAARIVVAEIDPRVTEVVAERMYLDPEGMEIHHTDARAALRSERRSYDLIVTDVFHDLAVPFHLTTAEYARLVDARLEDDGLYLANVVDVYPDPRLVKSLVSTLEVVFAVVDVWIERPPDRPGRMTWVVSAGAADRWPEVLESTAGMDRHWYRVTDILRESGTPMDRLPVLSDDFAPVEGLVSPLFMGEAGR